MTLVLANWFQQLISVMESAQPCFDAADACLITERIFLDDDELGAISKGASTGEHEFHQ